MTDRQFDALPFAARQEWTSGQDFEIWWDDPRDLFEVVLEFAPGNVPDSSDVGLSYWQSTWPKVRVPKGADVGSGREGWLAIDDWTNGRWQEADCTVTAEGHALRLTFRPLDEREFPEEGFPATFRRTIKLRLRFGSEGTDLIRVGAITDSEWEEAEIAVEWRATDEGPATWDGFLEVYNGSAFGVSPLDGPTRVTDSGAWTSMVAGDAMGGILATVRYAANEDTNSYDRTIVTVRSEGHTFSFLVDDVLGGEPVYVRDLGALVSRREDGVRLAEYEQEWAARGAKTLHERIDTATEQTWERAWADMPPKRRFYFVVGTEGCRQKFGVEPSGDIFLRENFIRRVPGKDTPGLQWGADGKATEIELGFGLPQVEPGDRSLVEGYLPVIRASWIDGDVVYRQEAFATWLHGDQHFADPEGDAPVVAMVRLTMANLGSEAQSASLTLTSTAGIGHERTPEAEALTLEGDLVFASSPEGRGVRGRQRELLDVGGVGDLTAANGRVDYTVTLAPGAEHSVVIKIPFVGLLVSEELARLRSLSYAGERARVISFWRQRIAQGAQIETPNQTLNDFYRTHLMHMLVINDQEPGSNRRVARCGGFHYGSFPDEGCMAISDLDRRGYTLEAERCLDLYVDYQGTAPLPGNFQSADGVFYGSGGYEVAGYNRNQGWVLWCLAEHYRYTRDRAWLERVAPALIKGCDWISRERQATMIEAQDGSRPIDYGFLPTGSLEDVTDYWTWLSTNAYAFMGLRSAAEVLAETGHPEAGRLAGEAEAYGGDLRRGFFEACARSPVVKLRDGTWVPHFPPRQQRRGRDFGWLREVLEGAAHLVYCGIIAPDEPAAQWIIDDYEDNLFLGDGYGYPAPDFERQWFSWGGFSMQPNLLIWPLLYLARDEPKHYLRSYFNPFASAFYPDTRMLTEHALPTLGDWTGDHFKSSDEALSTWWLRLMFVAEHGDELFVGQAIPREWFKDGNTMRLQRAMTHFGEVSLAIQSFAATGTIVIDLEPPTRNPPERVVLRVRHPDGDRIKSVWVDGRPHHAVDLERETISLVGCVEPAEIRVVY